MRAKEFVTEAFDQPYPMTWERGEFGMDALARLDDGTPLSIMFNDEYDHDGNEVTHVEFHRNHSQDVTGEGDAQRIFATVLAAIQQFIKDERPKRITFAANKEPGASRANLYKRLVDRFARPMGYQVDTREAGTSLYFDLTRRFGLREYKKYPTQEYKGVTFTMMEKDGQLIVRALNDFGNAMGYVIFTMDGRELDPKDLAVDDRYQRQGVASTMYDYIKSQGFTINRSFDQTDAGAAFWDKHRGEDEYVWEDIDAGQVLQYVKQAHAPDEFDIDSSITDHPRWELKNIPVSKLKLDPDGKKQDPYGRVNWVDYDKVQDLMPKISSVLNRMPIVVDAQGWIIDGNHRATAAAEAGLDSVPAYVPAEVAENFADGKKPGRKGLSRRVGIPKKASLGQLEKIAKSSSGERRRMAQWQLNMRRGKARK